MSIDDPQAQIYGGTTGLMNPSMPSPGDIGDLGDRLATLEKLREVEVAERKKAVAELNDRIDRLEAHLAVQLEKSTPVPVAASTVALEGDAS